MSGNTISLWHLWGLGSIVLSLSSIVFYWRSTITRIPGSIPWVGFRNEAFSKPRAWIRELSAGLSTVHEGYATVSPLPHEKSLFNLSLYFIFALSLPLQSLISRGWGLEGRFYSTTKKEKHLLC